MKRLISPILFFAGVLLLSLNACKHHPTMNPNVVTPVDTTKKDTTVVVVPVDKGDTTGWVCSPDTVYFQYDVLPVLISKCATSGCHDDITKEDGYQLTSYANTMKKGISAGRATNSKVYTEIANGSMPPRSSGITMTQAQKDIIAKWINQGAKNLTCNPNYGKCDTTSVSFGSYVQPIVQNYCNGCHTNLSTGGQILLRNHAEIKASVNTGKFLASINHSAGFSAMPKGQSKLSACQLSKINAWIKRGAPNN